MDGKLVGGIGKGERKEMWEVVQSCRQGWKRQRQVNSQLSLESLGDKRGGWGGEDCSQVSQLTLHKKVGEPD